MITEVDLGILPSFTKFLLISYSYVNIQKLPWDCVEKALTLVCKCFTIAAHRLIRIGPFSWPRLAQNFGRQKNGAGPKASKSWPTMLIYWPTGPVIRLMAIIRKYFLKPIASISDGPGWPTGPLFGPFQPIFGPPQPAKMALGQFAWPTFLCSNIALSFCLTGQ